MYNNNNGIEIKTVRTSFEYGNTGNYIVCVGRVDNYGMVHDYNYTAFNSNDEIVSEIEVGIITREDKQLISSLCEENLQDAYFVDEV